MTEASNQIAAPRDDFLDNLKGLLIVSVIFVHLYDMVARDTYLLYFIRVTIMTVQMPLFLFLCGYFGKRVEKRQKSAIPDYLITFWVFNGAYYLVRSTQLKSLQFNLFVPLNMYWFLFTLLSIRLLMPHLLKIRGLPAVSVLFALVAGMDQRIGRMLSLSRTICFLPFYLAGYYCSRERLEEIRRIPRSVALAGAAVGAWSAWEITRMYPLTKGSSNPYQLVNSYVRQGLLPEQGMLVRLSIYIAAPLIAFAVMRLCPKHQCFLTKMGRNSLTVYLLHAFPMLAVVEWLPKVRKWLYLAYPAMKQIKWLRFYGTPQLLLLIPYSLLVAWLFSREPVAQAYRAGLRAVKRCVFRMPG